MLVGTVAGEGGIVEPCARGGPIDRERELAVGTGADRRVVVAHAVERVPDQDRLAGRHGRPSPYAPRREFAGEGNRLAAYGRLL